VIERGGRLDFDAMQMRLHPAESRVRRLSAEIPAQFIAFDVLLWKGKPIHRQPLEKRRAALEKLPFTISPATRDPRAAKRWLDRLDAVGLDGVIAKRLDLPYLPGSREAVVKVKAHKTADCVVVGVRWKEKPTTLATLLLGLYREDGELDYVGTAAVAASKRDEILKRVQPLLKGAPDRGFSEPNRWGGGELEQSAVRPKLVVEVRYDKVQGSRFRHGTKLIRFREDKDPEQCTWREVRKPPGPDDLTVPALLASS
jgi:ATP-dependent DNA ligase